MKHILLGGSGFIGTALGKALAQRGDEVLSVSRSGNIPAPGITSLSVNLETESCPPDLFANADTVFILLGQNHREFDPSQQVTIIRNLAEALKTSSAKVFYFSTTLVYGHTLKPASETTPISPMDRYSTFKADAESILVDSLYPGRVTILRLSNTYGTPRNKGFVDILMHKLLEPGTSVTVNGDGQQRRDYLFIDDLIAILLKLIKQKVTPTILNIATGKSYSLLEVINLVSKVAHQPIPYVLSGCSPNEPHDNLISNTNLQSLIGSYKFTPVEVGLDLAQKRYQETL